MKRMMRQSFWAVALLVGAMAWAPAQDDPFAEPAATPNSGAVDDPFAPAPTEQPPVAPPPGAPVGDDPFAAPGSTAPDDPFAAPAQSAPSDDPFAAPAATATPRPRVSPTAPGPVDASMLVERLRRSRDVRGLWVQASREGLMNAAQVQKLAEDAQVARFNRIYAELRTPMGLGYVSKFDKTHPSLTLIYPNPVGELRKRANKDMLVIVVVDLFRVLGSSGMRPPEGSILGRYPDYISETVTGKRVAEDNCFPIDPGNPGARALLVSMVNEIQTVVRPDGYLFLNVGYAGSDWGYNPGAVRAFRDVVGGEGKPAPEDPVWSAWRREQVSQTLLAIKQSLFRSHPEVVLSVQIEASGAPPASWLDWTSSPQYASRMADWMDWTRRDLVDEIVFQIHERNAPTGNRLREWVPFMSSNVSLVQPIVSLSGAQNFSSGLGTQMDLVRSRGMGGIVFHYADPARDVSRGFFASVPNLVFAAPAGRLIRGKALAGTPEVRTFARMSTPPAAVVEATVAPVGASQLLDNKPLVFASPTPVPTPVQAARFVPEAIARQVTLANGRTFSAIITEATSANVTLQPVDTARSKDSGKPVPMGAAITIPRSMIRNIDPKL